MKILDALYTLQYSRFKWFAASAEGESGEETTNVKFNWRGICWIQQKVRNVMDCGAFLCSKTMCFKAKHKTGAGSLVVCVPDLFWKLMEANLQQRLLVLNLFLTGRRYQWLSSKSHSQENYNPPGILTRWKWVWRLRNLKKTTTT